MNSHKKLLIYGSAAAVILVVVISVLVSRLFSVPDGSSSGPKAEQDAVCAAVPSDAVVLFRFPDQKQFASLFTDTASFYSRLFVREDGLAALQHRLFSLKEFRELPFVYSLHYSAKNRVSFLLVSACPEEGAEVGKIVPGSGVGRMYNHARIFTDPKGTCVSVYKGLLLASNSSYVLESAVRHLENSTSVLDNPEFSRLWREAPERSVFVNHHQIGKLFSGVADRPFLGYSDFFLRFSSWSVFACENDAGRLRLDGRLLNNREEKYWSSLLWGHASERSLFGEIVPAGALFAVSQSLDNPGSYLEGFRKFLEVHKMLGDYRYRQTVVQKGKTLSPVAWIDSLSVREVVSAYCRFGDKTEWLTFLRTDTPSSLGALFAGMMSKEKPIEVSDFPYPGYMASLFGDLFGHCREEAYCRRGDWLVIGPKKIVGEFAGGTAVRFTLDHYMAQTPADGFLSEEGICKVVVNLKEGADSLLRVLKPGYRTGIERGLDRTNFAYLTLNLDARDEEMSVRMDFYSGRLKELPRPKEEKGADGDVFVIVDSTIALSKGPFELSDFTTGGKCYLEQTANNSIRYLNDRKRSVWAIPFDTPICGAVEQVDHYKNGKLQMIFASGNKLYMLDRLGRFVRGYPVTLPRTAVFGPKVFDLNRDRNYVLAVLDQDNAVSWYTVEGKPVAGWKRLKAGEFVKNLPEMLEAGDRNYWILRTVSQTRIYTREGEEITGKDKKKRISADSEIVPSGGRTIRISATDGKPYVLDLDTGKMKRP